MKETGKRFSLDLLFQFLNKNHEVSGLLLNNFLFIPV